MKQVIVKDITSQRCFIGFEGEKHHVQFLFDFAGVLSDYPNATAFMTVKPPVGNLYPVNLTKDGNYVIWDVSEADCANSGDGEFQITFMQGETVVKSFFGFFTVWGSLVSNGSAPTPVATWMEQAEALLGAFQYMTATAEGLPAGSDPTATLTDDDGQKVLSFGIPAGAPGTPGKDGEPGTDGVGIVSITKTGTSGLVDTYTILLTDGNSTTFTVTNGQNGAPGQDGYSPSASVTKSGDTVTITITDKSGTTQEQITSGGGGVSDVQVNGTSVVSQGVANVPVMESGTLGVAKTSSGYGVSVTASGILQIATPNDTIMRNGANDQYAVKVNKQHMSAFYGLSKAAGADLNGLTVTLGVYPETSKSKISEMLNAPETVSGTTPSITAKAGVRYICGEVATLTITPPASGDIEVIFDSGSTATVLTVPSTVRFPEWFDSTDLEANRTYDIIISNGTMGLVTSWAS